MSTTSAVSLPTPGPLLTRGGWSTFIVALLVVCALAPALNLLVPEGSPFHLSDYMVGLLGKIMCYAIAALAIDLIWGYTGILSLGHGLFFALGGYVMGMYLMRQIGLDGNYKSELPDFMVFLDWKELPWHWALSDSFIATLLLIVLVPGLVAFVFGYFAFRSRIKGVYFSIITQALTFAALLLFFRNETGFGGNNGFTDFKRILDLPIATPGMRMALFVITGLTLLGCLPVGALAGQQQVRAGAAGGARCREPRHVLRLQPAALQAHHLDHLGGDVRRGGRALCAAGRHHQPERNEPGGQHRDGDLGRGGRPRHPDRAHHRRLHRQRRQELAHRGLPRVLAVFPRRPVHCGDAVPAAGCGRAGEEAAGEGFRRRAARGETPPSGGQRPASAAKRGGTKP